MDKMDIKLTIIETEDNIHVKFLVNGHASRSELVYAINEFLMEMKQITNLELVVDGIEVFYKRLVKDDEE